MTPPGFTNSTASAQGVSFIAVYAAAGPRSGGFTTTINIGRVSSAGLTDVYSIARLEVNSVERSDSSAHGFSPLEPVTIDGEPALAVDYLSSQTGRLLHNRQVIVEHGGWVYTATYSAPATTYAARVAALSQLISTWRWT